MINLFIDTASSRIIIAVVKENKIISICNEQNGNDLSTRIFPIIDSILKDSNTVLGDIDTVYVVNGPGSFTGVRIGVTIAKTIAWSLNKKIIILSELELMATVNTGCEYVVSLIDARRDASFAGIYDTNGNNYLKDCYITNNDLIKILPKSASIKYVSYDNYSKFNVNIPDVDILKIMNRHKNDEAINPHMVKPEYLKLTEAEENLARNNIC